MILDLWGRTYPHSFFQSVILKSPPTTSSSTAAIIIIIITITSAAAFIGWILSSAWRLQYSSSSLPLLFHCCHSTLNQPASSRGKDVELKKTSSTDSLYSWRPTIIYIYIILLLHIELPIDRYWGPKKPPVRSFLDHLWPRPLEKPRYACKWPFNGSFVELWYARIPFYHPFFSALNLSVRGPIVSHL